MPVFEKYSRGPGASGDIFFLVEQARSEPKNSLFPSPSCLLSENRTVEGRFLLKELE